MTNKEKFKEVFGVELGESLDFDTSCTYVSQIVALRSMYIKGVDCICEWLNAEYTEENQADMQKGDAEHYPTPKLVESKTYPKINRSDLFQ